LPRSVNSQCTSGITAVYASFEHKVYVTTKYIPVFAKKKKNGPTKHWVSK